MADEIQGFTLEEIQQNNAAAGIPSSENPVATAPQSFSPEVFFPGQYSNGQMFDPPEENQSNKQHPTITMPDRLAIKTFQRSSQETVDWLNKQDGKYKAELSKDGEISVWTPGDSIRYRVDPPGFDLQDITDFAPEAAIFGTQSLLPGLLKGGAGVATLATGGAAAPSVPAAMAAGAAWSGGLEGLIGEAGVALGKKPYRTPGATAIATAAGGVLPGAGYLSRTSAGQAVGRGLSKFGTATKEAISDFTKNLPNPIYDIPWSNYLHVDPLQLAKAISQNKADFLITKEGKETAQVLPGVISRVMEASKNVENKLFNKPLFSGVIPKTLRELFDVAEGEKNQIGQKLGSYYAYWDKEIAPLFFNKTAVGPASELRPNKFSIGDLEERIASMVASNKGDNARATAIAAAEKIRASFRQTPYQGLLDIWTNKVDSDSVVHYATDAASHTANSVNKLVADTYRGFINDVNEVALGKVAPTGAILESGDAEVAKIIANKMASSDNELARLFSGGVKDSAGLKKNLDYVNQVFGDLSEVTKLANAAQASASRAGNAFVSAAKTFISRDVNPNDYFKMVESPFGILMRERVALKLSPIADAASALSRAVTQEFDGAIPRSLSAIRAMPGAFVKQVANNPQVMGFVQATSGGAGMKDLLNVLLYGPEEAASETLSKLTKAAPQAFSPSVSGRLSEVDGKIHDNNDRLAHSQTVLRSPALDRSQKAVARKALHFDGSLIVPSPRKAVKGVSYPKPQAKEE